MRILCYFYLLGTWVLPDLSTTSVSLKKMMRWQEETVWWKWK